MCAGRTSLDESCRTLRRSFFFPSNQADKSSVRVAEQADDGLPWSKPGERVCVGKPAPRRDRAHTHIVPKIQGTCTCMKPWINRVESVTRPSNSPTLFREEPFFISRVNYDIPGSIAQNHSLENIIG